MIHPRVDQGSLPLIALVMLAYVVAAWAGYQYLIMPCLAPIMQAHTRAFWLAVAHVIYGVPLLAWALACCRL